VPVGLVHDELDRILEHLGEWNGFDIIQKAETVATSFQAWSASDASAIGYAVVAGPPGAVTASEVLLKRSFTPEERQTSSGMRELTALADFFERPPARFQRKRVLHFTDSTVVRAVVRKGSPVQALHQAVWRLLTACRSHGISLEVRWLSRNDERIQAADLESRKFDEWDGFHFFDGEYEEVDRDDWGLSDEGQELLLAFSGRQFDFDLFASAGLHRAERWFAKRPTDGASGADAFAYEWSGLGFVLACPPTADIGDVIRKCARDKVQGMLVVPAWRTANYWQLVASDGAHINRLFMRVARARPVLLANANITSNTFRGRPRFELLFLHMDGATPFPFSSQKGAGRCLETCCD